MAENQFLHISSYLSVLQYMFINNLSINMALAAILSKQQSLYDLPEPDGRFGLDYGIKNCMRDRNARESIKASAQNQRYDHYQQVTTSHVIT